ncbi:MAG: DUF2721 domain-containing protein [Phycisphaeraceae bacterium]
MPTVLPIIQLLVAPVIMISACGLLCLALYNRLAAIISRARAFHKEWFDTQTKLDSITDPVIRSRFQHRAAVLRDQVNQILRRARLVRAALQCLLLTIICMLLCGVSLGLTLVHDQVFSFIALGSFTAGVVTTITAMILALRELAHALDPIVLEQAGIQLLEE